ncbi:Ribonuclease P protein component [Mycoplasmopsis bovigenitalium 51080]|uniref:Ribonuclease P protein component n=1 Tax=Mycoplasmopsis bovigenitalium 51080 TaxID=1188235 RepID=N9TSX3_9BACT|nr:ribonuclease P protein component [Mycoplasmopsis bovigenitalium]ENY69244.1 Ribonuclease P protein component [Mycoplasmopsis bovigenitalium 51080]
MKKQFRLQKSWEFDNVIKHKKQVVNKFLIVYFKEASEFKVGITVPKKFCNAVYRNYYKRQLKAIFHELNVYHLNYHFVVILRKDFLTRTYKTKFDTTKRLIKKVENGK